jgi:hypothetical protein
MNMKYIFAICYRREHNPNHRLPQNAERDIAWRIVTGEVEMRAEVAEMVASGIEIIDVYNGIGKRVM